MTSPSGEPDVAGIARSLTKAQQTAMVRECANSFGVADALMIQRLIGRFHHMHGSREYWLDAYTTTGTAVRQHLIESKEQ